MQRTQGVIYGRIYTFRRGADAYPTDVIVIIPGIEDSATAAKFLNAKAIWRSKSGVEFVGRVMRVWGKHGQLLVRFRRPLPGQALGDIVEIRLE